MNKLRFMVFICFCLLVFSQSSYSYSCPGTNFIDKSAEGLRIYYQKQSNLVIFTGKVLSVEKVKSGRLTASANDKDEETQIEEDPSNFVFRKVLTVETDKFWLGSPEPK